MVTRKELMDALEEVDCKRITLEKYEQNEIIDVFEKRGLIEHEPTAKEKYKCVKDYFLLRDESAQIEYKDMAKVFEIADAAIAEAEEGARE